MALPKLLSVVNGMKTMLNPASSSSASSIVATNAQGYIDPSFLPSVDVTGGTVDGAVIGGTNPAAGTFTTATATTQLLAPSTNNNQAPGFAFAGVTQSGLYWTGSNIALTINSVVVAYFGLAGLTSLPGLGINGSGAASSPVVSLTGALFTGGTGTTCQPMIYSNQGASNPSSWSTKGTFFGVNAPSGFQGNFLDFHINGAASVFSVGTSAITAPQITQTVYSITYAATISCNWTNGRNQKLTLTGSPTINFAGAVAGQTLQLELTQDSTGSRVVTWGATIRWQGGTAPTLTTTASKTDFVTIFYDGTSYFGSYSLNY